MNRMTASGRIREPLAVTNRSERRRRSGRAPRRAGRRSARASPGTTARPVAPVALDELERRLGVEAATHHDRAGHGRGDRELAEAPGVEHRAPRPRSSPRPATGSGRASRPAWPRHRRRSAAHPSGVPVVPEVSRMVRPGVSGVARRGAEVLLDQRRRRWAPRRGVVGPGDDLDEPSSRSRAGLLDQGANSSSYTSTSAPSRSSTSASWGAEKPVLSSSASAPSRVGRRAAPRRSRGGCGTGCAIVSGRSPGDSLGEADRERVAAGARARPRSASRARRPARCRAGGGPAARLMPVIAVTPWRRMTRGHPEVLVGSQRRDHAAADQRADAATSRRPARVARVRTARVSRAPGSGGAAASSSRASCIRLRTTRSTSAMSGSSPNSVADVDRLEDPGLDLGGQREVRREGRG